MSILDILPKGYGTYIVGGIGLIGTWAAYGLSATGVWTGGSALVQKACTVAPSVGLDADTLKVIADACTQVGTGPITLPMAFAVSWTLLMGLFIRRAIGS